MIPGPVTPAQLEDVFQRFKKAFIGRAKVAEISQHLGYPPGQAKPEGAANHRNGSSVKTALTAAGALAIEVPRVRQGSCEPVLIGKHERRFMGFDGRITAMCLRGMTVRKIQGYLAEIDSAEVSPDRNSLDCASWKHRKAPAASIKPICTAPRAQVAQAWRGPQWIKSKPPHTPKT